MNKEISAADAAILRTNNKEAVFLDVREDAELAICRIDGAFHIPMSEVPVRYGALPKDVPLVVLCHHGMRSMQVSNFLVQQAGFGRVFNVSGGIDAYSRLVDPTVPRY